MVLFVKVLSIAIIVYGCLLILRPSILKNLLEGAKKGDRVYYISGAKVVVGILLMIASRECAVQWLILFFGAVTTLGAGLMFLVKKKAILQYVDWVDARPVRFTYFMGGASIVIGALMILAV